MYFELLIFVVLPAVVLAFVAYKLGQRSARRHRH
jgi:hypothetical protein